MQKPTVLMILDGWGIAPPGPGNAVSQSKLTYIPRYWVSYPHTQLTASGEAVGLPPGEDGNTETGHINIGAGRTVYQDLPRINMAIADGTFFRNEAFLGAIQYATANTSHLHLIGLIGAGGVHSNVEHLYALIDLIAKHSFRGNVFIHTITDGRDSFPKASPRYIDELEAKCKATGIGKIATVMGRYYAMDRDTRWERTQIAYDALTGLEGVQTSPSAKAAIEASYAAGKTDEFIMPTVILDESNKPIPRIQNKDAIIFFNFRIDRPRQLTKAFVLADFEHMSLPKAFDPYDVKYYHKHVTQKTTTSQPFTRKTVLPDLFFVTMTEYERGLPTTIAFPPQTVKYPIGRVYSELGLRQLRLSETEKERFIGYYLNGIREDPFAGEDRIIVPSARVATYDLKPEMSALELTQRLLDRLSVGVYSFIAVNFANADMVGHTGNIPAAIKACEVIDSCVGQIVSKVLAIGGTCVITADHGNVEEMLGPNGEVDTEHSTFPVPFIFIDNAYRDHPQVLPAGKLGDIAPSILAAAGIQVPSEMTGRNLLADAVR